MKCLFLVIFSFPLALWAQGVYSDTLPATVLGNDTLMVKHLPEINVKPQPRTNFKNRRQRRYYGRLQRDVKKTLPYAKLAGEMLVQVSDSLNNIQSEKEKKHYLKLVEEQLLAEYEPVLRKMTIRQGRVLIKLIDRECMMTSFEVLKVYRGGFSAFFWQGIARLFGNDLKSVYDPQGEDALMEEVVQLVEAGVI